MVYAAYWRETMIKKIKYFMSGSLRDLTFITVSGIALFLSFLNIKFYGYDTAWISVLLCGIPIIKEALEGLIKSFDIKADLLVSMALIASLFIGEIFAAGEVAFIMQIGGLLEEITVSKARAGIEKLVHLTPRSARRLENGDENIIPVEEIKVGDVLRVLPGETIPVDGVIISGNTSINQAVMTGESLPVDKSEGDDVSSGTINQFGSFDMKALKTESDSSIQRMIKLIKSADAGKAKIVGIADKWATWIVVIALFAAFITWLFTGEIIRSVTILVVFCPCALVLATPTAIMAAIGNSTKHGFLVKEGDALERLSKVGAVAFDKTGTLTYGRLHIVKTESFDNRFKENDLLRLCACAEMRSEHPIGKAVSESCADKKEPETFEMFPGKGVKAFVCGYQILAGNIEFMRENKINFENTSTAEYYINKGCTIIYVSIDEKASGFIALSDTVRENSKSVINSIKNLGIKTVLLTGDHKAAAENIAAAAGINIVYSSCLPEDKMKWIDHLKNEGIYTCMIGDGINDAPALKRAFVGIAMGETGSDIAVDAADIALVNDDIKELPHILMLSKKMMKTIKINLTFSMTLNFLAIILAITGILNPVVGALVHNAGSVAVIINSALLLKWKKENGNNLAE